MVNALSVLEDYLLAAAEYNRTREPGDLSAQEIVEIERALGVTEDIWAGYKRRWIMGMPAS